MKKILLGLLKVAVTTTIFVFLIQFILQNFNQLNFQELNFNPIYLIFAIPIFFSYMFLYSACWRDILITLNSKISLRDANNVYATSNFYRYIPGRVALFVARVFLSSQKGVSKLKSTSSMFIEVLLIGIAAIYLFTCAAVLWFPNSLTFKITFLITLTATTILILHPKLLKQLTTIIPKHSQIKHKNIFWLVFAYTLIWILQGTGFYMIISSMHNLSITLLPFCIGIFAISWLIGFLGILTPGGIGIREGTIILLGSFILPPGVIILASIIARLLITFAEVFFLIIIKLINYAFPEEQDSTHQKF